MQEVGSYPSCPLDVPSSCLPPEQIIISALFHLENTFTHQAIWTSEYQIAFFFFAYQILTS